MFEPLDDKISYPKIENEILEFWDREQIFEKSLVERKESPYFTFYEGPPTVNGKPGIHHMMARTIKDAICRYKTMNGYYVRRQAGWDTHGLPVEIQVEKDLGLKDKTDILEYGLDKFNEACREFVYKNIEMADGWRTLTRRMGYWVNMDEAYITCTNEYIESVWWAIQQYFDKGLIYRGFKVVPQSPTIETPLSSHELSLGYKEVRDPNCYIKLKVLNTDDIRFKDSELLVWTTTPWTLFANVALAIGKNIDYVKVKNTRKIKNETIINTLILAKSRLIALDGEHEILEEFKGEDLLGIEYEQILPYADLDKANNRQALTILEGDFVTTDNGSGIVHIAPAFGEDDYRLSRENNIPFIQPVTPNGHLTNDMGEFSGRAIKTFVYEDGTEEDGVDKDVIIKLKQLDKIYRSTNDYLHNYPHCWRTGNPIMYYARESWFIKSPEIKDRLVEINDKDINWQPKEIGSGRFGNWLNEVKDWSLSRDRFWGTPLPLWVNENDNEDIISIGSIEQLKEGFYLDENGNKTQVKEIESKIDLHKPFVDNIIFEINGKTYKRVPEVIDVWFDSGSMPFAQMHYPFENKELFEKSFPSDFIAEGIDQTRGWFYTLHNIATALFDKPAYKNIVVNELILDKNGVKMSKRLGNTVDPFEIMESLGADAIRWYLFVNNPPWNTTKFDVDDISKVVISDFFRSLTQTYNFFSLYANIDGFNGSEEEISVNERPEIDKWILSRINTLQSEFLDLMNDYELTKAHRAIQDFAINELSNWYIRRNRRRFWKGENDSDKISAYQTLRTVLIKLLQMTSSTAPFLSEYLYQRLKNNTDKVSIHLSLFSDFNIQIKDEELEERMAIAQKIVYLARALREKSQIKTRQPLKRILIPINNPTERRNIQSVEDIIKEELNIKEIEFVSDKTAEIIKRVAKPNFNSIGKKFGKLTNLVANEIRNFSNETINLLESGHSIELEINHEEVKIILEDIEIHNEDIEGWLVANEKGVTVALDTHITADLREEGIAREFINRIQSLRKDSGFEVVDRIRIEFYSDSLKEEILNQSNYIKNETLAERLEFKDILTDSTIEIDDVKINVKIQKL